MARGKEPAAKPSNKFNIGNIKYAARRALLFPLRPVNLRAGAARQVDLSALHFCYRHQTPVSSRKS